MTIAGAEYHEQIFNLVTALGDTLNSANAVLVPTGFEQTHLLIKQFPTPVLTGGQEIEIASPGGGSRWGQAPIDTKFQGAFSIYETEQFIAEGFFTAVLQAGGFFNAIVYEGTPQRFSRARRLVKCFAKVEAADRDMENKAQPLIYSGTLFGHYFGGIIPGNIA